MNEESEQQAQPVETEQVRNRPDALQLISRDLPPESASAVAQSLAMVQAHFALARMNPRKMPEVVKSLLERCRDPEFALEVEYTKPVGGGIKGLSARFSEAVMEAMGNLQIDVETTHDDPWRRTLKVWITDFERNNRRCQPCTLDKVVERSSTGGRRVVEQRKGAGGKTVYLVPSTPDEVQLGQNNIVSKAARNLILQLLSPDVKDQCQRVSKEAINTQAKKDPAFLARVLVRVANRYQITEGDLLGYLGRKTWPAKDEPGFKWDELIALKEVLVAIQDGEATWEAAVASREKQREDAKAAAAAAAPAKNAVPAATGSPLKEPPPGPDVVADEVEYAQESAPAPTGHAATVIELEGKLSPEAVTAAYQAAGISMDAGIDGLEEPALVRLIDALRLQAEPFGPSDEPGPVAAAKPEPTPAAKPAGAKGKGLDETARQFLELSQFRTKDRAAYDKAAAVLNVARTATVEQLTPDQRKGILFELRRSGPTKRPS